MGRAHARGHVLMRHGSCYNENYCCFKLASPRRLATPLVCGRELASEPGARGASTKERFWSQDNKKNLARSDSRFAFRLLFSHKQIDLHVRSSGSARECARPASPKGGYQHLQNDAPSLIPMLVVAAPGSRLDLGSYWNHVTTARLR